MVARVSDRNAWDRPPGSYIPNRNGDKKATPIYMALGRALSAWEGVEAAMSGFLHELLIGDDQLDKKLFEFGETFRVKERAKIMKKAWRSFLESNFTGEQEFKQTFAKVIEVTLDEYEGFSQRRNELAHGCVTPMWAPDYSEDLQPIRKFHSLVPSHSRIKRWPNVEPEYNYVATEIKQFAKDFVALDNRIESLACKTRDVRSVDQMLDHNI